MSKRSPIHTKGSAMLSMRSGGVLWMFRGMYGDGPHAEIRDGFGTRTVRYATAQALVTDMRLVRDEQASSWAAKKYILGGAA